MATPHPLIDSEDRNHMEAALQRSETYLAEAQKLSHTGSFSWRPASGEISWSEETYRIYGISPTLAPTLDMARQCIHPEDLELFAETVRNASLGGRDFICQHRLLLPNGIVKYLHVVARVATHTDGGALEYLAR